MLGRARIRLTAKREFALHHDVLLYGDRGSHLDEVGETGDEPSFEAEDVAGFCGTEDFNGAQSSEFETGQWRDFGVALGDDAGELGGGFDQQNAREKRLAGKVAAQERFLAAHRVFAGPAFARV